MKRLKFLGLLSTVFAVAFTYWWLSPEQVASRQVKALFAEFSGTVASNDREAIGKFLNQRIASDAKIQLDVSLSVLGISASDGLFAKQQFTKESFITFIDNTLFPLESYALELSLKELLLKNNRLASINAEGRANASGLNYLMGKRVATRWVLKSDCSGEATLDHSPMLSNMHCVISLNQEPDLQDKTLHEIIKEYEKNKPN